jgi:ribosomal protein S27E
LVQNLEEYGLEKLSEPSALRTNSKSSFMRVRYTACGHERDMLTMHISNKSIGECDICYEKNLQDNYATPQGFEIIGKEPGPNRLIKFSSCGHTKVVGISNMKAGSVTCQICITEKFKSEAIEAGLEYICPNSEKTEGKKKHWYKAPCGHSLLSRPGHIRIGHWTCRECNAGYLDRINNLYIFEIHSEDGFKFLKLGYSLKPEYRKLDYVLSPGTKATLIKKVQVQTGSLAIKLENSIHAKYKEFNIDRDLIKRYLTESGFTECYPFELKTALIEELNSIENLGVICEQ